MQRVHLCLKHGLTTYDATTRSNDHIRWARWILLMCYPHKTHYYINKTDNVYSSNAKNDCPISHQFKTLGRVRKERWGWMGCGWQREVREGGEVRERSERGCERRAGVTTFTLLYENILLTNTSIPKSTTIPAYTIKQTCSTSTKHIYIYMYLYPHVYIYACYVTMVWDSTIRLWDLRVLMYQVPNHFQKLILE